MIEPVHPFESGDNEGDAGDACLVLQWHFLNPDNFSLDMAPASDGLVPSPPV